MDRAEALRKLKRLQKSYDTESAHSEADGILCELLYDLGYQDVVSAYHQIYKWFA